MLYIVGKFVNGRKKNLAENILICVMASLAGTFLHYELHFESVYPIHSGLCVGVTVLIALMWSVCAVQSGRDGKFGFLIFTLLYYGIPYIYLLVYAARDNVRNYSKHLAALKKVSSALLRAPFEETAEIVGTQPEVLAFALCIFSALMYAVGFAVGRAYRNKTEELPIEETE